MSYPVPLITSITPWMWYDADDATTITTSGSTLTGWRNKGSTGTSSFGSLSGAGTGTYNTVTANGRPLISFNNRIFTTNSVTLTSQSFAVFAVYSVKSSYAASVHGLLTPNNGSDAMGGPSVFESAISGGVPYSMCMNQPTFGPRLVGTSPDANGIGLKMGTWVLNTNSANSLVANNGMLTTLVTNNAASGANTTIAYTYNLNNTTSAIMDYGEVLIYMGELSKSQRQSIEGYLAWKWGLQFNLPPQHPHHPYYNKSQLLKLPVPLNNDVLPWMWYDADDPTTITTNNTTLVGWQNKGTTGSTAGGTITGTVIYGTATANGRPLMSFNNSRLLTAPVIQTSQSWAVFAVYSVKSAYTGYLYPFQQSSASASGGPVVAEMFYSPSTYTMNWGNHNVAERVVASSTNATGAGLKMGAWIASTSTASNVVTNNGNVLTLTTNTAAAGSDTTNAYSYNINPAANAIVDYGEVIVYMGAITTTQRYHIEGYLAWKWGLQASLPVWHPYHPTYKDTTLALYVRPRLFVSTYAGLTGSSGTTDNTTLLNARFTYPAGMCVDPSGNMYVAESGNHAIRRITPAGNVSTFAGLIGSLGTTDATGTNARFNSPYGIAINPAGTTLYVADTGNHRIRQIVISTQAVTTLAGPNGTTLTSGYADGTGVSATFFGPWSIAVHPTTGDLYVADQSNHRIRKVTTGGVVTTPYGPSSATAPVTGTTDAVGNSARFNLPRAVAFDNNGILYVGEGPGNRKIRKIDISTGSVTSFTGVANTTGTYGHADGFGGDALFSDCINMCFDSSNNMYVCDGNAGNSIRKISPSGGVVTITGPAPTATTAGTTDAMDVSARFNNPLGILLYNNDLYVSDHLNHSIRKLSMGATNQVGTCSAAFNDLNIGIALDGLGNVYSTTNSHVIYRVNIYGTSGFFAGSTTAQTGTTDAAGTNARFNGPCGLGVDPWYNLYVADFQNNRIRRISPAGLVTTFAGTGTVGAADGPGSTAQFNNPRGIGCDRFGNIYVTQFTGQSIRKITPKGFVSRIAGTGTAGSDNAGGNALIATMNNPSQIAVDSEGNLFIMERGNNLLRRITPAGVISTFAGSGSNAVADGTGTGASFKDSEGLCVDANDSLYVTDLLGHTMRRVTTGAVVTTIAGLADTTGLIDGVGSSARFWLPSHIAIDDAGNMFLADYRNAIIRCIRFYNPGRPLVTGLPSTGLTLLADTSAVKDRNTGIAYIYQWLYSDSIINSYSNITNATNSSYIANLNEVNEPVRAYATYTNTVGSTVTVRSDPVGPVALVIPGLPSTMNARPFTSDGYIRFNWRILDQTFSSSITIVCSGPNAGTRVLPANTGETIFTGLSNSSNYNTDIFVTSAGGVSSLATSYRATVPGVTPSEPLSHSFSIVNTNQLRVTWSEPGSTGGSPIGWYAVSSSDNVYRYGLEPFRREFISPPLPSGTYTFLLRAINSAGYGAPASSQIVIP